VGGEHHRGPLVLVDENGYRAFKLKAGVLSPQEDVRRLLALRETCPQARLRLDYNEGASDAHLRAILGPAREVAVEYCEQPYPVGQERRLERLREWFDVPISLDESVVSTQDLLRVAESKLCEYVSVKFSKVGGLSAAVRIARLATELGITPYVGSQSETRLGVSAALAAMAAVDGLAYGSDFYFPYLIVDDTEIVGGPRKTEGHLGLPAGAGHGCTVPDSWWDGPQSDRLICR
jgi:L-alanine-DL-glutamate epimerase-like enolase superfamily enzyme